MDALNIDQSKNGIDEPFTDPVVRCDTCQKLLQRETIKKHGACTGCGNRRVRNINFFNEEERDQLESWGYHEFLKEFEVADE